LKPGRRTSSRTCCSSKGWAWRRISSTKLSPSSNTPSKKQIKWKNYKNFLSLLLTLQKNALECFSRKSFQLSVWFARTTVAYPGAPYWPQR